MRPFEVTVPPVKRLTLLLTVVGAFVLFASTASAMCVYNYTDEKVSVLFICGFTCQNDWTLDPATDPDGGVQCRPGKGGGLNAGYYVNSSGVTEPAVILPVEANGWAELRTLASGDVQVCSYAQNRSLKACQSYDPKNSVAPPRTLSSPGNARGG